MRSIYLAQKDHNRVRYSLGLFETKELKEEARKVFVECGYDLDKYHNSDFYKAHRTKVERKGTNNMKKSYVSNILAKNCKNKSGYNGICFDKTRNKWRAYIHINNKIKNLGRFDTLLEAIKVRDIANKQVLQTLTTN